jgi:hypothetical protein
MAYTAVLLILILDAIPRLDNMGGHISHLWCFLVFLLNAQKTGLNSSVT